MFVNEPLSLAKRILSGTKPTLSSLPTEIQSLIFNYLSRQYLGRLQKVSADFQKVLTCLPYFSVTQILDKPFGLYTCRSRLSWLKSPFMVWNGINRKREEKSCEVV